MAISGTKAIMILEYKDMFNYESIDAVRPVEPPIATQFQSTQHQYINMWLSGSNSQFLFEYLSLRQKLLSDFAFWIRLCFLFRNWTFPRLKCRPLMPQWTDVRLSFLCEIGKDFHFENIHSFYTQLTFSEFVHLSMTIKEKWIPLRFVWWIIFENTSYQWRWSVCYQLLSVSFPFF